MEASDPLQRTMMVIIGVKSADFAGYSSDSEASLADCKKYLKVKS